MAHTVAIINGKEPNAGNGGVSDADFSHVAVNFFSAGVIGPDDYEITEEDTPDMTVKVATGKAYVPNAAGTMLYETTMDTVGNATITTNAEGNPRIDAVVIKVDTGTEPNEFASNVVSLVVVAGEAAASPIAPDDSEIQTAVGSGNAFLRVADVTVANGAASITNADISDTRTQVTLTLDTASKEETLSNKTLTKPIVNGSVQGLTTDNSGAFDLAASNVFTRVLDGSNGALSLTIVSVGQPFILRLKQDGTGSRTVTWFSTINWAGGTAPTLTTTANKTDVFGFLCTATNTFDGYIVGQNL